MQQKILGWILDHEDQRRMANPDASMQMIRIGLADAAAGLADALSVGTTDSTSQLHR